MDKNQTAGRTGKSIGGKSFEVQQGVEENILNDGIFFSLVSADLNINTNERALDIIATAVRNGLVTDIQGGGETSG